MYLWAAAAAGVSGTPLPTGRLSCGFKVLQFDE